MNQIASDTRSSLNRLQRLAQTARSVCAWDWRKWLNRGDDAAMPKVDAASHVQEFMLGDTFQKTFDEWKARVEQEHNGTIVITHEEVVLGGTRIMVFWRIEPKHVIARPRR